MKVLGRIGSFVKRHKKVTVLLLVVIAAGAVGFRLFTRHSKPDTAQVQTIETATVEKMDLSNSISVTGTIATAESKTGTTTLSNIEVTKVYVEVGDEVQEGDIICTFDSSDLEESLADAKNNYSVNQKLDSLENYETTYTDTLEDAEDTLDAAKATRDAYKAAYANAVTAEEEALANLNKVKAQYDTDSLKSAYESAKSALQSAIKAATGESVTDVDSYVSSSSTIPNGCEDAYNTYKSAKSAYEQAQQAIAAAQSSYEQAQQASTSAYNAYSEAQSKREQAQDTYDQTVEQAEKTYEKAKLQDQLVEEDDALNKIESYEEQIEDCVVYASMSGTITTLNVEEGNVFSGGTIYEIQDTDYYIVEATVDEYDVTSIEEGMTAYVKTDSVDEEMAGTVSYVAVTGTSGQTMGSTSGTASYEVQIKITDPQEKLRSGMTASVSIALEESKDTLAVPYDCVQTNDAGESVVYVDDNGERKEVVVEKGIESDYYIEVSSSELSEGMTVYYSTPLVQNGGTSGDNSDDNTSMDFNMDFGGGDFGGGSMPSGGGGMPGGGF